MAGFSDQLDAVDAAILGALTDPALFRPAAGGEDQPVDIVFEIPADPDLLDKTQVVVAKPTAQVAVSQVANIVKGDALVFPVTVAADGSRSVGASSRLYVVQGKPPRPDEGRWWTCDLADTEPAT